MWDFSGVARTVTSPHGDKSPYRAEVREMENNNQSGFVSYTAPQSLFGLPLPPLVIIQVSPPPAPETETAPQPEAPKAMDQVAAVAKAIAQDQARRPVPKKEHGLTENNIGYRLMGATLRNMERGMPYASAVLRASKWMRGMVDEDSTLPSHDVRMGLRSFLSSVEATAHQPFTVERVSDLIAKRAKAEEVRGAKPHEAMAAAVGWVKRAIWRDTLRVTNAKERDPLLSAANACLPPKAEKPKGKQHPASTPMDDVKRAFSNCPADKKLACAQAFIHRCVESIKLSDQEKSSILTMIEDEVRKHFKASDNSTPISLAEVEEAEAEVKRWMDRKIEFAQRKVISPKAPNAKGNNNRYQPNVRAEQPRVVEPKKSDPSPEDRKITELKDQMRPLETAMRQNGAFLVNVPEESVLPSFAEKFAELRNELDRLLETKAARETEKKAERIARAEASAKASRELPKSLIETPAESRKRHREKLELKANKEKGKGKNKGKGGKKG